MNGALVDDLMGQLQGPAVDGIADQLGTDPGTAGDAIAAALPLLVGALGRNAQQPEGAAALLGALQRDHSGQGAVDLGGLMGAMLGGSGGAGGGLGGLLDGVLGGAAPASRQFDAGGILGHILGGAQPRAEAGLAQATGLQSGQAGKLLMLLAPIVMSALARRVQAGQLDAGGLGGLLGQERMRLQQQAGAGGGLLGAVLDQDGDGQVGLGDLLSIGGSLLGGRR